MHGEIGSVEEGFADADLVHEDTFRTQRVQHASLETHGALAWFEENGDGGERIVVRSSTQVPFLTRRALRDRVWLALEEHRAAGGVPGRPTGRHPSREGSV
ncbi:hypothetical protein San01_26290 [Streptomyces angustmyceticus]|uniref:Aldehyde oxidase/xanthine dehydrogenase first molybdopterin binding domain-containing protein n=1 Tax=Streptomyces angustmyceticus TaxID=285578 RepID=A0A5J4LDC4_9ACTN|nr:hypothetical protein San01_26290 [Streptomyces angustmyceticus]